jgi:dihydroorotate dehydrogenase
VPLLVKIAPDLDDQACTDIAELALAHGIEGLIVSNTTIVRPPSLRSAHATETGGLSGAPLFEPSTEILSRMRRLTEGRIVLVGVGGISSGAHAYAKIRAGASLVQLYTALTYDGPALVAHIKRDLLICLQRDRLPNIAAAVGLDVR